jgi:hypothetical protein
VSVETQAYPFLTGVSQAAAAKMVSVGKDYVALCPAIGLTIRDILLLESPTQIYSQCIGSPRRSNLYDSAYVKTAIACIHRLIASLLERM